MTLTAAPGANWHFVNWTGDTNGGVVTNTALTVTMDRPRALTANFALNQYTLEIQSPWGGAQPPGPLTNDFGAELTLGVTNSPLEIALQATQLVCTGWSASGLDPASGAGTNTGPLIVTTYGVLT